MGCFYTGFDWRNRKNGYFKIGETSKDSPSARFAQIRQNDAFQCLGYLKLIGETKAQRLMVESYVRAKMEQHPQLTHTQNDHFLYTISGKDTKYSQAQEFADYALNSAKEICEQMGIQYEMGTKTFKR